MFQQLHATITALARKIPRGIRWVDPENIHLTLHFLGPAVPRDRCNELIDPCQKLAHRQTPFCLTTAPDIGQLPVTGPARVLIIACGGLGLPNVCQLHGELGQWLKNHGFPVDRRAFQPHLTLGRVKTGHFIELPSLAQQPKSFMISNFTLFSSTLTPSGPIYRELHVFPFSRHAITRPHPRHPD